MAKVTVYKIKLYDAQNDSSIYSRRMATPAGADRMNGWIVEDTATEIDEVQLEEGEQWTPIGFNPHPRTGFQTQVVG